MALNIKALVFTVGFFFLYAFSFGQRGYWQQRVDNDITVQLDDQQQLLRGHIRIMYQNNAPDTLSFIYFHLYPNAYSSDRTAYERQAVENGETDHYFSEPEDRGAMDSLQFAISADGESFKNAGFVQTKDPDIIRLILPEPLLPGGKIEITTPFRVKIPLTFSRLGRYEQSYQISQWFPKPAVYDAKGWHPIPYLDQGEFYSEYGSYNVAVTLPADYIIMGTGNIQEPSELEWLSRLSAAKADSVDASLRDSRAGKVKTVTFKEDNVHDFAWFADKRWLVKEDTVLINGEQEVRISVCYLPENSGKWQKSVDAVKKAMHGYSDRVGAYPYHTVKVVEGSLKAGGGMEYPTVTIIGNTKGMKEGDVHKVIVHEVGHNWFYGILGSNERLHPWLDEGINSYYEKEVLQTDSMQSGWGKMSGGFWVYAALSATHNLVPADTAADLYPHLNYGVDIYQKTSRYMKWLEAYMGRAQFDAAMKSYFDNWKFRHPYPEDFAAIFRAHSEKNIDWFFDALMKSSRPVDFAIGPVRKHDKGWEVTVHNRTGLLAPALVCLYSEKGDSLCQWTKPFTDEEKIVFDYEGDYEKIVLAHVIPDYNFKNNTSRGGLRIRSFFGSNMDEGTKIWITPALGFNYYDGFMAGLLVHNLTIPLNKFQFAVAPLFAFGSKTFAGTGRVSYTSYFDEGLLHDIEWRMDGKTFSYYKSNLNIPHYIESRFVKLAPEVIFTIRKPYWRSSVERKLSVKGYWIREDNMGFSFDPSDSLYRPYPGGYSDLFYGRLRYTHVNSRTFNPFSYAVEGQVGETFAKISAEVNLRVDYHARNKALHIRGYAGKFFTLSKDIRAADRYRLTTTYSGKNDYLYDETYLGRTVRTGFYAQQVSIKEGGFKLNTLQYGAPLGMSDNWLLALNIKTDLPLWNLPIRLFADVATCSNMKENSPNGASLLYEAGVELYLGSFLSVYLPVVSSKDFTDYGNSIYPQNRFLKTIAFSIQLGDIQMNKLSSFIFGM